MRNVLMVTLFVVFSVVLARPMSVLAEREPGKDVVDVAIASKDHGTLVKAVVTAELVEVLKNPGPFTVFAPTDEAFKKLPAGTVEGLLKPESKEALRNILQYHVSVGVFTEELLTDGRVLSQANGDDVTIASKNGARTVNGAKILGTVRATNGIVHVIDTVLLPPPTK